MRNSQIQRVGNAVAGCLLFCLCLMVTHDSWGGETARSIVKGESPQKMTLVMGKSTVLQTSGIIKRVSLADPQIAEAIVLDARQIYLIGKAPGVTNLTLWKGDNTISEVIDVEVVPNFTLLKEKLHSILPDEKDIRVSSTGGFITLSGTVSSAAAQSQVLALVEPYAPTDKDAKKAKIINLLEVGGVQQVMLEVTVSEMSRSVLKRMGVNLNFMNAAGEFGLTLLNSLTNVTSIANLGANPTSAYPTWNTYGAGAPTYATPYTYPSPGFPSGIPAVPGTPATGGSATGGWPGVPTGIGSNVTGVLRFFVNGVPWTVLIDALKQNGLLKVLAEPTLVTLSGQQANFLAGGEIPYLVPSFGTGGSAGVQYKPYGVGLGFTPTVLSSGKIHMTVTPEVSELDFSVVVLGSPATKVRRVSTSIELADGQSFAIAGLLQEDVREVVSKFPLLGDLPIIGVLFRSSEFLKRESELIVIVTPHLVKPLDKGKQPLPTDAFIEPDDFEFYLMGRMESKSAPMDEPVYTKPAASKPKEEKQDKNFGHIIPKN